LQVDTSNILFICGGAFEGMEKIIENRLGKATIGFSAPIMTKKERNLTELFNEIQPHDFVKYGLIPELVGRLPVVSTLSALTREDLVRILTEPRNALTKQYARLFELDNVMLRFTTEALDLVADKALERNIGARGLRSVLEETMMEIMFETPGDPTIDEVTITAEAVDKKSPPQVSRDPARQLALNAKQTKKPQRRPNVS
jgi:ATP-dependent Clp protease ATP-binding subunit ClpX